MPMPGETMTETEVIAPRSPYVLIVGGEESEPQTSHIRFRGFTFEHTNWYLREGVGGSHQAADNVHASIVIRNAHDCEIRDSTIAHVSGYGVEVGGNSQNIGIINNVITDLGGGGVRIGHNTSGAIVLNNEIAHGGKIFHSAVGIHVGNSGNNVISHNTVHDFYYSGISVGWSWDFGETKATDNLISNNHIHDIGKGWLSDMGGIYTLGESHGTRIVGNLIHDVQARYYGGWGIYSDSASTGMTIENNVIHRTTHGGYMSANSRDNIVRNNIFAFGKNCQVSREPGKGGFSFTFERNIVYYREGSLLDREWEDGNFECLRNCYYRTDGEPVDFLGKSFHDWEKEGNDKGSIMADPLFENPTSGNFTLKLDSPVFELGFKAIDLSQVGRQ